MRRAIFYAAQRRLEKGLAEWESDEGKEEKHPTAEPTSRCMKQQTTIWCRCVTFFEAQHQVQMKDSPE